MSVRELLGKKSSEVMTVGAEATLSDAARLMMRHDIGGLPVVTPEGEPVGFLAEREIVRALDRNSGTIQHLSVRSFMRPVASCGIDDPLHEVMARMTRERLRHIVVKEGARIRGIVSVGDMVKHRLEQLEVETGVLRDYLIAQRASS